jgi:transposase
MDNESNRRQGVALVLGGTPIYKVAAVIGFSRQAVGRWVKAYREGGDQALVTKGRPGRPARLTDEQRAEIATELAETTPMTASEVRQLIVARYGVVYHTHHVSKLFSQKEAA